MGHHLCFAPDRPPYQQLITQFFTGHVLSDAKPTVLNQWRHSLTHYLLKIQINLNKPQTNQ